VCGEDPGLCHDRGLGRVLSWDEKPLHWPGTGSEGKRECALGGLDSAVQGEFAYSGVAEKDLLRKDTGCAEDGHGNGKIEPCSLLFYIGRGEVDGDALGREWVSAVFDGGLYPFSALPDRAFRKTHNIKAGKTLGDIDLDLDRKGLDPDDHSAPRGCEHAFLLNSRFDGENSNRTSHIFSADWKTS